MSASIINFHTRFLVRDSYAPMDGPDSSEISDLCASVVGNDDARSKLPLLLARHLEERFILAGWPVGRIFGSEPELTSQCRVGRDVMREAVRILEGRGCARMKRGPQGGLEILRPSVHHLHQALLDYASLTAVAPGAIVRAWVTLHLTAGRLLFLRGGCKPLQSLLARHAEKDIFDPRAMCSELIEKSGSKLLGILVDCLTPFLTEPFGSRATSRDLQGVTAKLAQEAGRKPSTAPSRLRVLLHQVGMACLDRRQRPFGISGLANEQRLAAAVVRELMRGKDAESWAQGILLGNEFDLCDRFGVDKSVVRQAIRIMEASEIADARAGRGRGLVSRRPSTAPLSRQLCSFIASRAIAVGEVERLVEALEMEIAGMAARRIGSDEVQLVNALLMDLAALRTSVPIGALQRFERFQHGAAKSAFLSAFLDGAKAYLSWNLVGEVIAPPPIAALYADHTAKVYDAIRSRDSARAMERQYDKLLALRASLRSQSEFNQLREIG
ncbi:FCD domain-containing protein [Phenylobacterium montanum]|uniref:FCD domain-containing protein n=1 Tax=Phenylobacterium montanum TaxID=2823693 RepID=A0A975G540_9CAUL|nr:FCD domain-containing protein [Caulobacter sp. S6]QUD90206.1 FCD domain-containing protein [Caulobacter sp. S6]